MLAQHLDPPPEDLDALEAATDRARERQVPLGATDPHIGAPLPAGAAGPSALPVLPGLEVLDELGRGGMGIVYKARRVPSGELVALKVLHDAASLDPKLRERALTEGEAGIRLDHPNIVKVHQVRQYRGAPYLVLEYVEGETLARHLNRRPLPERRAAELTRTLARAVAYAHKQDVVHRDLKPGNVLLSADGVLKVNDFGLARLLDAPGQTTDGRALGTPQYMPPEQAAGEKTQMRPAVDVYALGATLYEMLTGRPPFLAASAGAILGQVLDRRRMPKPPSELNPEVSRNLEAICLKCLEKEPAKRYASANDLADDLSRFLGGERVRAPLWTRARALRKWTRHNPLPTGLIALLCLVVFGGTTWLYAKYRDEETLRLAESEARRDADDKAREAVRRLYTQTLHRADQLGAREPDHAFDLLNDPALCPPALRGVEWALLVRRFAPPHSLAGHEGDVFDLAISPDGTTLATAGADHGIRLWDARSRQVHRHLRHHTAAVTSVCFHPDGSLLASAGADRRIAIWAATSGEHLFDLPTRHKAAITCLAFSPDGKTLASGGNDRVIRLWGLKGRALTKELTGHLRPISSLSFSPNGKALASGGGGTKAPSGVWLGDVLGPGEVKWWSLADGRAHDVEVNIKGGVSAVAFSPGKGEYLAIACSKGIVALLDVAADYKTVALFDRSPEGNACLAFSPDGKFLAVGSEPDSQGKAGEPMASIRIYDPLLRRERCQLRGHPMRVHAIAFGSTDLSGLPLLASAGCAGSVQMRPLPGAQERVELARHTKAVSSVALSADGRVLLSGGHDGAALVWDVAALDAPRVVRRLLGHNGPVRAVALGRSGRRAATGGRDRRVRVWDLHAPNAAPLVLDQGAVVTSLRFLADGQTLVSADERRTIRLWDGRGGEQRAELKGHAGAVSSLALHPDGRLLASAGERPDAGGKHRGEVLLWDVSVGRLLARLEGPGEIEEVSGVAFSPDGKTLASGHVGEGGRVGMVRLWDVVARELRTSWKVERGGVRALSFAPRGWSLVTSSCPDTLTPSLVQFWDEAGEERLRLPGGGKQIRGLHFASGRPCRLAGACFDHKVIVWEGVALRESD